MDLEGDGFEASQSVRAGRVCVAGGQQAERPLHEGRKGSFEGQRLIPGMEGTLGRGGQARLRVCFLSQGNCFPNSRSCKELVVGFLL